MKKLLHSPVLIVLLYVLAIGYAVVSKMTLANAIFLIISVLIGTYLGSQMKGKK
ncbi:MAG: hypothetical protein JWO47_1080 [Candidatus Saccharibacteria bacterium]|nr:hypothetical protein [Candidatus Saccharibacteria bacterium]